MMEEHQLAEPTFSRFAIVPSIAVAGRSTLNASSCASRWRRLGDYGLCPATRKHRGAPSSLLQEASSSNAVSFDRKLDAGRYAFRNIPSTKSTAGFANRLEPTAVQRDLASKVAQTPFASKASVRERDATSAKDREWSAASSSMRKRAAIRPAKYIAVAAKLGAIPASADAQDRPPYSFSVIESRLNKLGLTRHGKSTLQATNSNLEHPHATALVTKSSYANNLGGDHLRSVGAVGQPFGFATRYGGKPDQQPKAPTIERSGANSGAPPPNFAPDAAGSVLDSDAANASAPRGFSENPPTLTPDETGSKNPIQGDVYLDGTLVGRWIERSISRLADRVASSATGFDPRRTPLPVGNYVGG
jgi:hypothetical protein